MRKSLILKGKIGLVLALVLGWTLMEGPMMPDHLFISGPVKVGGHFWLDLKIQLQMTGQRSFE
jgi:hypothetical protein